MGLPMFRAETDLGVNNIFRARPKKMHPTHFRKNALRAWTRYRGGTISSVHNPKINHYNFAAHVPPPPPFPKTAP